jgi:hypothetical protein
MLSLGHAPQARADEFDRFPWLVKVSSTFEDSAGGAARGFEGHGFVVRFQGRHFLATASHLSQGGAESERPTMRVEAWVSGAFRPLRVLRRVAHNRRDVEVMEVLVPAGFQPLAAWEAPETIPASSREFFPRGRLAVLSPWRELFEQDAPAGFVPLSLKAYLPETSRLATPFASPMRGLPRAELQRMMSASSSHYFRQALDMGVDATDGEFVAALPSHPGLSGLPLIARVADCLCVDALVTSSSRAFSASWFVPDVYILFTLFKLAQLPRELNLPPEQNYHQVGDVYWRQRAGLLYRVAHLAVRDTSGRTQSLDFEEAAFDRRATGNGTRADGGNGTRADGGNGTRADGGAGAALPPDLLAGTALLGGEGMTAFVVPFRGVKRLLPADFSSFNWILERLYKGSLTHGQVEVVRSNDRLIDLVRSRLESLGIAGSGGSYRARLVADLMLPLAAHRTASAEVIFEFASTLRSALGGTLARAVHITLRLDGRDYAIDLDAHGAPIGSSLGFEPFAVLRSASGDRVEVDLSGLLLTSTSTYNFEWEAQRASIGARFGMLGLQNPSLRFRVRASDGREWQLYLDHLMP